MRLFSVLAGLGIPALAVAFIFPLLPWSSSITQWRWGTWPLASLIVAAALLIGGLLLPAPTAGQQSRQSLPLCPDPQSLRLPGAAMILGLGGLFVLAPLVHLGILAWAGWRSGAEVFALVLPAGQASYAWADWLRLGILWVVLPSVSEEFFFRGRLQPWLARQLGPASAISLSTLWFVAVHGQALMIVIAIPFGLFLGLLRHYTASLYACILVHAAHNALLLALGGLLISHPDLALLLFLLGAWLLLLTFQLRARVVLVLLVMLLPLHALYRSVHQHLWLHAASQLIYRAPPEILLIRLESARRQGVLAAPLQEGLGQRLAEQPHPDRQVQTWLRAVLDPEALGEEARQTSLDHAYLLLRDLAAFPVSLASISDGGLQVVAAQPLALVYLAQESPSSLPHLMPLPDYEAHFVSLLRVLDIRHRLALLSAIRLAWDVDTAARLHLSLPADLVQPRDRLHLLRNHPAAARRIQDLEDPEQRAAWMPAALGAEENP